MMSVITVLILIAADLGIQSMRYAKTIEERTFGKFIVEGALQQLSADIENGTATIPGTHSFTVDTTPVTITSVDNSLVQAATIQVSMVIEGRTYVFEKIISKQPKPHPFFYALFLEQGLNTVNRIVTGAAGENGDVHIGGNATLTNVANDFNGDLEITGLANVSGSVNGNTNASAVRITKPNPSEHDYRDHRTHYRDDGATINGYAFIDVASQPQLIYVDGDLNLRGTFSGQGVIYVRKDLTITGDITYANASSKLIVIVEKDIDCNLSVNNIAGFFLVKGDFSWIGLGTKTLTSGSIAADRLVMLSNLKVTNDPFFFQDTSRGLRFYLPGYWNP